MKNRQEKINPSLLGMLGNENILGKGSLFFFFRLNPFDTTFWISMNVKILEESKRIFYQAIVCSSQGTKFIAVNQNISPSIREYAQQLKYNLKIEKQTSIVTDSKNKFQQKWHKILHAP